MSGKRAKQMERRVLKGFNISTVDSVLKEAFANQKAKNTDFFRVVAKAIGNKNQQQNQGDGVTLARSADPIGSSRTFAERRLASYRKTVIARGGNKVQSRNNDQCYVT